MNDAKLTVESFRVAQQQIIRRLGQSRCHHANATVTADENGVVFCACDDCGLRFAANQKTVSQWHDKDKP